MGPALSQRLIEAMGGRLRVRQGRHELSFQITLLPATAQRLSSARTAPGCPAYRVTHVSPLTGRSSSSRTPPAAAHVLGTGELGPSLVGHRTKCLSCPGVGPEGRGQTGRCRDHVGNVVEMLRPRLLTPAARTAKHGGMAAWRRWADQHGLGLIELVLVLAVLAVAGVVLFRYLGSTARTVEKIQEERPAGHARLIADQATLASIRIVLQAHHAQNGQWPADKAAVLALLASPPRFQCADNNFEYDPAGGNLRLLVDDPARC